MRVKAIGVRNLFGLFDHEIPLVNHERLTIVHGPNGFGKTVMLKMIAGLLARETAVFEHTPFDEFYMKIEDGTTIAIRRKASARQKLKSEVKLEFFTRDRTGSVSFVPPSPEKVDIPAAVLQAIDRYVPSPFHVSQGGWADREGNRYTLSEILDRFPAAAEAVPAQYRPGLRFEALKDLQAFFVQTNRLGSDVPSPQRYALDYQLSLHERVSLTEEQRLVIPRVKQYSDDILKRIQAVLADYAKHSQESDRTFPERLVRFVTGRQRALPEREILEQMAELENKRRRFIKLGLLDSESGLRDLAEEDVKRAAEALTIYVGDVQQKLQVFDDMAHRIGSLVDIINERFEYKRIRIDRANGFRIVNDQDQRIQLEDLSSGEQHELVVLYELLFRAPKNGLILVDEPEISLHVAWQSRFLSDLIRILELTDTYAIVATHSPVIIGTRWDLTVQLTGPEHRGATQSNA
jgi:predicted ATP-binding protein involved in virulence